jgi:cobalt-zinc-cadmium efflux system protein
MLHPHRPISELAEWHMHHHGDGDGHAHAHGPYRLREQRRLAWAAGLTGTMMVAEAVGGWLTNSLALLSDAGHMLTHFFALAISLLAIRLAALPTAPERSFGLFRVEMLAALFNGLTLLAITAYIVYEATVRLLNPAPVAEIAMLWIAVVGLAVNLGSAGLLAGVGREDLNVRSAFLHMVGDTLSSVAIIIGAVAMYYTGRYAIDPLVSLLIALLIARWGWGLVRDSLRVLLEAAPRGLSVAEVSRALEEEAGAKVHDVHLWQITSGMHSLTAHVAVRCGTPLCDCQQLAGRLERLVRDKFGIGHAVFQFEERHEGGEEGH